MKLRTELQIQGGKHKIGYDNTTVMIGSCFAQNMGAKLQYFQFPLLQNPFGILFHPLAIERLITYAIGGKVYTQDDVFYHGERWHCYDAHSQLSAADPDLLLQPLHTGLAQTRDAITDASHIIITLGTAWVYELIETSSIVANCHKVPQSNFQKHLLSTDQIKESLQRTCQAIRSANPQIEIIFSISPVRHLRDGFVENQRSKGHLITALHEYLGEQDDSDHYFPAYEIMMDELRDYRFYREDMVHPSPIAVDYIWTKFRDTWIDDSAHTTMQEVQTIQRGLAHRPFHPESAAHLSFLEKLEVKIADLSKRYPHMHFNRGES